MFSRGLRAETRSKAKEDLRKVHKFHEQVRCWEKKWVAVKDTSMLVYKWVPSVVVDVGHAKKGSYNRQSNLTASHVPTTGLLSSYSCQKSPTEHTNVAETTESNHTKSATQMDFELKLSEDTPSSASNDSCTATSNDAPVNNSDHTKEDVQSDISSKPVSPVEQKTDLNELESPSTNPVVVKQCDEPAADAMETS